MKISDGESQRDVLGMFAALNITAIGLGFAAGGLSATVATLVISGVLNILGVDSGVNVGLVVGVAIGLAVGGWVAGFFARHSGRFHGAIAGLLLAALVVVVARMGGSPADSLSIVWLFALSGFLAGTAGWLAGRRKMRRS